MIEQFLNNFYDCLHFSQTEAFPAERFASLFAEHAVLIEHQPHGFQTLSIAEFIASMNAYQAEMIVLSMKDRQIFKSARKPVF